MSPILPKLHHEWVTYQTFKGSRISQEKTTTCYRVKISYPRVTTMTIFEKLILMERSKMFVFVTQLAREYLNVA